MSLRYMPRLSVFALAAMLSATSMALATTHYVPPAPPGDEGYPNKAGEYEQAYVTQNVVVRSRPSSKGQVVNRLSRGDFVNVGDCRGSWCYVDVQGGSGWMSGRFIGRGENPYHRPRPAGPGIPPQEPGTDYRGTIGQY